MLGTLSCVDFEDVQPWGFSDSEGNWVSNNQHVFQADPSHCQDGACGEFKGAGRLELPFFMQSSVANALEEFSVSLMVKRKGPLHDAPQYLVQNGACEKADSVVIRVESAHTLGAGIRTTEGSYLHSYQHEKVRRNFLEQFGLQSAGVSPNFTSHLGHTVMTVLSTKQTGRIC